MSTSRASSHLKGILKSQSTPPAQSTIPTISSNIPSILETSTPLKVSFLKDTPKTALFKSFCNISFDISSSSRQIDKLEKILQLIISTLQEIDEMAFIAY